MKNTRLASGLCLALATLCTGCIGPFNAFNGMVHWNQKVTDSKWGNEAIFLGLFIIPVYEVMFLADLIIFNSIEFWSGSNPIAASTASPPPASK
jgi:hypothetical protein